MQIPRMTRTFTSVVLLLTTLGGMSILTTACWADQHVKIGVLANRGKDVTSAMWTPTASYLSREIPDYRFKIVPLDFAEIVTAVERKEVDFILTNPSCYIELETTYGASRTLTLRNRVGSEERTVFGGVIFTRSDRSDIRTLADLRDKSFMAASETSLGGWRAAWRELKDKGINPYRDFSSLRFGETHDAVVLAVKNSTVDAGTIRTDILERMTAEGKIKIDDFYIINRQSNRDVPFIFSTRLYPEWPFAKLRHTDNELAQRVIVALLSMQPENPAAKSANIWGWTVPLDYYPTHELMKELQLGPYKNYGRITPASILSQYGHWIVCSGLALLFMAVTTLLTLIMNRKLVASRLQLVKAQSGLEQQLQIHRQTETELWEINSRLQILIQAIPSMVFFKDKQLRYLMVNKAVEEFLGKSRDEIEGKTDQELLPQELRASCALSDKEVQTTLQTLCFEEQHILGTGEKRLLATHKAPIFDTSGDFNGLVGVSHDITEHKRSEEALREANKATERQLRFTETLLRALPMAVFYKNADGRYLGCNKEFSKIMGVTPAEITGKTVFELWPSELAYIYHEHDMELLSNPSHQTYESKVTDREGRILDVVYSKDVFMDENDQVSGIIGAFIDITERKNMERALSDINATLTQKIADEVEKNLTKDRLLARQARLAEMGEMIGAIAHQWRQPLNALSVIIQDIQDAYSFGELDEKYIAGSVGRSLHQIGFMTKTIDDFKNFFRPDKEKKHFDMKECVTTVISMLSAQLQSNGISFSYSCCGPDGVYTDCYDIASCQNFSVYGYENELKQAFMNIIINSKDAIVDACKNGTLQNDSGIISLCFECGKETYSIRITDNGGGISENVIERIFEPYFTTKETGQGTGIGLYMAKMIIENNMGGHISVRNAQSGAEFTVTLPSDNRSQQDGEA